MSAKVIAVVQARTGSSRFPGKVLAPIEGEPMLSFMLRRLRALECDELVVATSTEPGDDAVAELAAASGASVVRGSEVDVLSRFMDALEAHPADHVVRLTADCPLIDVAVVHAVIDRHLTAGADYTTNVLPRTFPKGLDCEVVTSGALRTAAREAGDSAEREHVTPFVYRRPRRFVLANHRADIDASRYRWTVDTTEDLAHVQQLVRRLGPSFGWREGVAHDAGPATPQGLYLRTAMPSDAALFFELRNDPVAVAFSGSGRELSWNDHVGWFSERLSDPASKMWVAEDDGRAVAIARVNVDDGEGTVSIAVDAARRGHGYGRAVVAAVVALLVDDQQVLTLNAVVHRDNRASVRVFESNGFHRVTSAGSDDVFCTYRREVCE